MRLPTVKVIFDRKHLTPHKDGAVEIRISMDRKQYYISTGVKSPSMRKLTTEQRERISIMLRRAEKYINFQIEHNEPICVADIKGAALSDESPTSFLDFVEERARIRPVRESTRKRYYTFINVLTDLKLFVKFSDLTTANIHRFNDALHQRTCHGRPIGQAAINNYHKMLKLFCHDAIILGKLKTNPYDHYDRIDRGEKEVIDYLTETELKRLRKADMPTLFTEHARDLFVFQTLTALSYSDLMHFDIRDYTFDGRTWYRTDGTRQKTGKRYVSKLSAEAIGILKKYGWKLPTMPNQNYNRALKMVAVYAGIKKNLHSHMARSTFATLALSHGASVQSVSKMLGHATPTLTMKRYAKILSKDVLDDLDKVYKEI